MCGTRLRTFLPSECSADYSHLIGLHMAVTIIRSQAVAYCSMVRDLDFVADDGHGDDGGGDYDYDDDNEHENDDEDEDDDDDIDDDNDDDHDDDHDDDDDDDALLFVRHGMARGQVRQPVSHLLELPQSRFSDSA